jgi:uncharacterized protein
MRKNLSKMISFLALFLTVYSSIHVLFFFKARVLLPDKWVSQPLFIVFLTMMVLAPIGTRLLERNDYDWPARVIAHVGFPWMGFIFLSFVAFFMVGALDLFTRLINPFANGSIPSVTGRGPTLIVLVVVSLIWLYGFVDARNIRIERVNIVTEKLPEGIEKVKVAQISDVHLGLLVRGSRLRGIVERINSEDPDILVSTGDLVDGNFAGVEEIFELLREIKPRYGKFAVTGNHEYYVGLSKSIEVLEHFGFRVLRGEMVSVAGILNVAGVDDPTGRQLVEESAMLALRKNGLFTVLLKHRPEVDRASLGLFDLQLSGHAHRGQIFPFNFLTGMVNPMQDGFYDLEKDSMLYTSRGTGTWGPPIRVLSPPEVTIIEITRQEP